MALGLGLLVAHRALSGRLLGLSDAEALRRDLRRAAEHGRVLSGWQARTGTKTAIRDLRQLGRGIHPSILTDSGLDTALSALVARSPLPTTLDVRLGERCGQDAEATVYFAASEALANAAKHAGATPCSVRVARRDDAGVGWLVAEIADNGRGGARVVPQGGLAGLTDRLGALGGRLDLRSSAATGTTVTAAVPCA